MQSHGARKLPSTHIYIYIYALTHLYLVIHIYIHIYIYLYIFMIFRNPYWFKKGSKLMSQPGFHGMKLKGLFRLQLLNRWGSHTANQTNKKRTGKESPPEKNQRTCMSTVTNHQLYSIHWGSICFLLFWCVLACMCASQLFCVWICSLLRLHLFLSRPDSLCHECRLAFLGQRGLYLRMANLCQLQYAICVLHRCGKSGLQSPIESDQ